MWASVLHISYLLLLWWSDTSGTGLTAKDSPWVSEETLKLDLWTILELLQLWGLLETDKLHFSFWYGPEPWGSRNRMWFKYIFTGLCFEFLIPTVGTILGGSGNFGRWGLAGRSRSLGMWLWRLHWDPSLLPSAKKWRIASTRSSSHHDVLPKPMGPSN
jgi:hypothetical protein